MHETNVKIFNDALPVINRALLSDARAASLFEGAKEGDDVFVTVFGANPDEDDEFALRIRGGALEIVDHSDPHQDEHHRQSWTIRLDDLKRIVDERQHYTAHPDRLAKLVICGSA